MTAWRAYVAGVLAWSALMVSALALVGEHGTPWWLVPVDIAAGAAIYYWCYMLHRRSGAPR